MRQVIHGEIYSSDFNKLNKLVADWASAYRFAFCRFQKDNLSFNDTRNSAKSKYPSLNVRQVSDAVMLAQGLFSRVKDKKVVFGGKWAWDKLNAGKMNNKEWKNKRDNQIYARGDMTKQGNPNIRLLGAGTEHQLRVTVGNRQFETYKLFIPSKFLDKTRELINAGIAYNVRLLKKDNQRYKVIIDYGVDDPKEKISFDNGVIGVDINPDRIAISNLGRDGNLISSLSFVNNRIFFASTNKRDYEIGCMVKKIINYALTNNKGIVYENLKFKKEFVNQGRKFNRVKSNFVWRKILILLEKKCIENGIKHKGVNPAFTSVIGRLKYQEMFKLSIHEAASFVIGRRGLGLSEKMSLYGYPSGLVKDIVFDLAGNKTNQIHSWAMWRILRNNYKAVLTELRSRLSILKELDGNLCYVSENLTGKIVPI